MKGLKVLINGTLYVPADETPAPAPVTGDRWERALESLEPDSPTGAWGMSDRTARAQVGMSGGREASRRVVQINLKRKVPGDYWSNIETAAARYDVPKALLTAVFCRESHHGAALDSRGEGDRGQAFGVGQVDKRYHQQQGRPDPYSLKHMLQCSKILADFRDAVARKHPTWPDRYVLRGAAVAYNSGPGNVATIERMDRGTTGHDYGADVMARAQYYLREA